MERCRRAGVRAVQIQMWSSPACWQDAGLRERYCFATPWRRCSLMELMADRALHNRQGESSVAVEFCRFCAVGSRMCTAGTAAKHKLTPRRGSTPGLTARAHGTGNVLIKGCI